MKTTQRILCVIAGFILALMILTMACPIDAQTKHTFAALDLANTWSAVQTFTTGIVISGTTINSETGSGALVRGTNPTIGFGQLSSATIVSPTVTNGTFAAPVINTPTETHPTINTGIVNNGSGVKHIRVSTGSLLGNSQNQISVLWPQPFADANYTLTCNVYQNPISNIQLSMVELGNYDQNGFQVAINNSSNLAQTGTLFCIAIHD